MDDSFVSVPLAVIFCALGVAGIWSFISLIISYVWGWHALAQHYRGDMTYFNKKLAWRSGRLGWGNYSSILTFTMSDEDLGLSILFLYRAGHPPLKFPFEEIKGVEKKMFLWPEVHLSFERMPHRTLKIRKGLAEQIERASGGNWRFERQEPKG